jgi:hypothetical protein
VAFNADDIWEFPAAAVVAAEAAVEIGPNHAAPAEANPGAILQAAVLQHVRSGPLGHYYSLLVLPPPLPPKPPASPLLKETHKYQGLGKLVCLPFLTAVRMGGFSLGEAIPSAVKSIIGMTCNPDASCYWT